MNISELSVDKYPTNKEVQPLLVNIRRHSILYPIIIDQNNAVIDGVRRLHVASILGYNAVPTSIKTCSKLEFYYLRISLNLHRLAPLELKQIVAIEPNLKLEQLSYAAGIDPDYVIKGLRLTKIKKHLRDVPLSVALHLVSLESYAQGASQDYIHKAREGEPNEVITVISARIKEIKSTRRLVHKKDYVIPD